MAPAAKPRIEGRALARALWRLGRIYWSSPEAKWGALLLAGTIALQLGAVFANVLVASARRDAGDALGGYDAAGFSRASAFLVGAMLLAAIVPPFAEWLQQRLRVRWRRHLTAHLLERWIGPQAYCQVDLHRGQLDNPDVRIAEDVRDFVASSLGLSLSLLSAVVTFASFAAVLWSLSRGWTIPIAGQALEIPGLLLWLAVGFAIFSMWITHVVGRRLVPLNFDLIRLEADVRYGLVRYRDHGEAVALLGGAGAERAGALARFQRVVDNFHQLSRPQRNLATPPGSIGAANSLIPFIVAALAYFAHMLTLGVIVQTSFAYGQVAGALAWFIYAYQEIARWRANIERLAGFSEAMDATHHVFTCGGIELDIERAEPEQIRLEGVAVEAPRGHVLIEGANATLSPGQRVALVGRAGSGRTMLMRAIAGIWPFGQGRIERPPRAHTLYLAQQPYLPIGSLRDAVTYPSAPSAFSDERIVEALRALDLDHLATRLDDEEPWDQQLGGDERQRLALARVLLHEPAWILLERATSSLDEGTEQRIYDLLRERLPRSGLLSVTERPAVLSHLSGRWTLTANESGRVELKAA